LQNLGKVFHKKAIKKDEKGFKEQRKQEILKYESDFDRAVG
jgi:hypothetical protein